MPRGKTFDSVVDTTFATPMVRLNHIVPEGAEVYAKLEYFNPCSSVKDRIGRAMIEDAEKAGIIDHDTHIVEPTSGNTGIALAFVCAAKKYKLTLTMPDTMSVERRALLRGLGANLVLTPDNGGMRASIEEAAKLVATTPNAWMPQQFENPANPQVHEETTGPEIWQDTDGDIDVLVAGVGTGGTISGVGRYIKKMKSDFKCVAVEPAASPVISGGKPAVHAIQGIGAGFIPKNLDRDVVDDVETISNEDAYAWARRLSQEEGIMGGISSGANVCAAARLAERDEYKGKKIVVIIPSFSERYLSTHLFDGLRD